MVFLRTGGNGVVILPALCTAITTKWLTPAGMLADRILQYRVHDVSGSDVGVMIADMFRYPCRHFWHEL